MLARFLIPTGAIVIACVACEGASRAPFAEQARDGDTPVSTDAGAQKGGQKGATPATPREAGTDEGDEASTASIDPEAPGPLEIEETSGSREDVAMHAFYPSTAGEKYPVVVFAHGFQIPPSQYEAPLKHLASFGYVAVTADFKASLGGDDNTAQADQLCLGLDWVAGDETLAPLADADRAGMSGHSLGGKLALLAATRDPRVKASIVFDPVDGNGVTVAPLLSKLGIPTAFLGETLDGAAGIGGQACAPTNANYKTFYKKASPPSLAVTIDGASHMSFLDDVASCGLTCSVCKKATIAHDAMAKLTRGFLVAFYERHLKNLASFDTYLHRATDGVDIVTK